jgi:hypothetical protein
MGKSSSVSMKCPAEALMLLFELMVCESTYVEAYVYESLWLMFFGVPFEQWEITLSPRFL